MTTAHKPLHTMQEMLRGVSLRRTENGVHELIVVDLDPPILYATKQERGGQWDIRTEIYHLKRLTLSVSIFWNASVSCLITTQALTNRSKVMPLA